MLCLNKGNNKFTELRTILQRESQNSSVILVGDWNVVQDYNLDTINYRRKHNPNSKLKLHSLMNDLDLIGIWREQHQNDRTFSWREPSKSKVA